MTKEVVVLYLACERCRKQRCYVEDNRGQGVISRRKLEEMKWCGCMGKTAWSKEAKVQQSGTQSGEPESTAKEGGSQREVRRTFGMLREVWLNIGVEKIDTVRATRVEHSRRFLSLNYAIEYVTTYLQEIPQRIR